MKIKRTTKKKIRRIAKTAAGAAGGAVICGGGAIIDVALAPLYIAANVVTGAIDGASIINGKKTIIERVGDRLNK